MEGAKEHIERFEEKCKGELLILNMFAENLGQYLQDDTMIFKRGYTIFAKRQTCGCGKCSGCMLFDRTMQVQPAF